MTEKLIVIDTQVQEIQIHEYAVDPNTDIDEDYIAKLGFDTDHCVWFFGTKLEVIKHKGILL